MHFYCTLDHAAEILSLSSRHGGKSFDVKKECSNGAGVCVYECMHYYALVIKHLIASFWIMYMYNSMYLQNNWNCSKIKCIPLSHLPLSAHFVMCVWWEMWRQLEDFGPFWRRLVGPGSVAFSALVLPSSPVQLPLLVCSFCICWTTLSSGCRYHRLHCLLSARPCPHCTKQDHFPPESAFLHLYAAEKTHSNKHTIIYSFCIFNIYLSFQSIQYIH